MSRRFLSCLLVAMVPATVGAAPAEPAETCLDESCLLPAIRDLSVSDAHRYFRGHRAISYGFDAERASGMFRQNYATLSSFVGNYEEAERLYPLRENQEDPVSLGYTEATYANPLIVEMARGRQAVFLNESHARPRTRAALHTLLRPLREAGFGYLAIEALTTDVPGEAGTCSDAAMFDGELPARGYPVRASGFYLREPVFGEIVREALRLGFRLVAYETRDTSGTMEGREQGLAGNLACIYRQDPDARVLAIAGFGHVAKSGGPVPMMAQRFREMTGIDPLTVDTTRLLGMGKEGIRFPEAGPPRFPSQAYVLSDASGRFYGSTAYDLIVFVPGTGGRHGEGASWLELDGARRRMPVPAEGCGAARPCLVQATVIAEDEGIPADSCVLDEGEERCVLFLAPGMFRVDYLDARMRPLASRSVTVE